eukprot:XP_001699125.1 predicted protein [Chlamydomonas reinhardtii]
MSITAWDIKEAAFTSDIKEVEELILTSKGATDVGAVAQAANLRSLSLAFNALTSLSGLGGLGRLQSLNVSHNQLASLKGVHLLTGLATLNASHNKVASLAPLSALTQLTDLWLQNNAVAAPPELRVLAGLSALQRLAIGNNPVAKVIDGRPVDEQDREMYRAGGVAVSWDSAGGGFVQYPSGGLMLIYSRSTGAGCLPHSLALFSGSRDT